MRVIFRRRKENQRERIIAEAVKLFQEHGGEDGGRFETTTIEAIAERADISVRTFFIYFDSKADVIYLDTQRSLLEFRAGILRSMENNAPLLALVRGTTDEITEFIANPINTARLFWRLPPGFSRSAKPF